VKVLVVSNMYPGRNCHLGTFIKQQVEELEAQGLEIVKVVKDRTGFVAYFPFVLKYIFCLLFRSYDIVHAYYGFHSALFAAIIKRRPLIITFVGSDALREPLRNRIYQGLQRFVISRSNHLIAVSSGIGKSLICELGADPGKVSLITFGINFGLFRPIPRKQAREKLGFPSNKRLVLFPSSPKRREKRFDIFERTVELLKKDSQNIVPVILNNNGRPYAEVPLVMNACDVLVLTSDSEGSPTVVKEAMACNLPIVSVNVGDAAEIIKDTRNCYVCEQDPSAIADKIKLVLDDGMRTNGRDSIGHLSSGKVARKIVALYRELTQGLL